MYCDGQTLHDLDILPKNGNRSIFDLLNHTKTAAGCSELRTLLSSPFALPEPILSRQRTLQTIMGNLDAWRTPLTDDLINEVCNYFSSNIIPMKARQAIRMSIFPSKSLRENFHRLEKGVQSTYLLFSRLSKFRESSGDALPEGLRNSFRLLDDALHHPVIVSLLQAFHGHAPGRLGIIRLDRDLRKIFAGKLADVLKSMARIEAMVSLAKSSKALGFRFPKVISEGRSFFSLRGAFHPMLKDSVRNNFDSSSTSLVFLTGPNMAGKSTFIKACGISVYLAQLGMAVPAEEMVLRPFEAMATSIKTEEYLHLGRSYFYAEVHRMKEIALTAADSRRALVIIDEPFKGTNVKDAYECSLRLARGLLHRPDAFTILCSHLTELAEALRTETGPVFLRFTSQSKDGRFEFSYKIGEGVSTERIGLAILEQEGVLDLLDQGEGR